MNIQRALDMADQMKPNMMSRQNKIQFLQELDQMIYEELLLTHVHTAEEEVMPEYDIDTEEGTELLAPDRYGMMYVYWIMTRIDQLNQEEEKENNDRARFENKYEEMSDWWTRTKRPLPCRPFYRI